MSHDHADLKYKLNIENILNNNSRKIFNITSYNRMQIRGDPLSLKSKIEKNVFIIGLAWVFLFTAFSSMANLQSSLNTDQGLGTASLTTIYITLVISSMFLPPILIEKFGLKWTIVLCQFSYLFYIAANIIPRWTTLIPSACLLGIFACGLWSAKCTYLTRLAYLYSELMNEVSDSVVNRFFGIFFAMFQTSQILGNLISSLVLKPPENPSKNKTIVNLAKCGANDCPVDLLSANNGEQQIIQRPQDITVYTLCFIYLTLAGISIGLIIFCLDSFGEENDIQTGQNSKFFRFETLMSTVKHMSNQNQILLIPITLWLGFSLAFIGADYTKSFVACSKGVDEIGFAMICFGLTDAIGSYFFGKLHKIIGRKACIMIASIFNYLAIFMMRSWKVNLEQDYFFYMIPGLWGIADAAWQTQINSLYGVLFKHDHNAGFSNFRLWESLGFAISYAYANHFCTSTKLNLLLVFLTIGLVGYMLVELLESKYLSKNNGLVRKFNKAQALLFGALVLYVIGFILFF